MNLNVTSLCIQWLTADWVNALLNYWNDINLIPVFFYHYSIIAPWGNSDMWLFHIGKAFKYNWLGIINRKWITANESPQIRMFYRRVGIVEWWWTRQYLKRRKRMVSNRTKYMNRSVITGDPWRGFRFALEIGFG